MNSFKKLLNSDVFDKDMIVRMLDCNDLDHKLLLKKAQEVRLANIGNEVYGRALIELSNICKKDCYYCGIRKSNIHIDRYMLDLEEVKKSIDLAISSNIGSIAIQSGESTSPQFIDYISDIISYIRKQDKRMGITLSCGEQKQKIYKKWLKNGATRYLLRIETSNENLYYQYHPENEMHNFKNRMSCLSSIMKVGYQTGTGIMIGLPNQSIADLAEDILFMKNFKIHMCGMGPFIPCAETPLQNSKPVFENVYEMSLRMIAVLRIVMKDINIVASTAMETMNKNGRRDAIIAGANVIMPNINPAIHRKKYSLYNKKPIMEISTKEELINSCKVSIPDGYCLSLGKTGDSMRWKKSNQK